MPSVATERDFEKHLEKDLVLVDFWAVWCGPCRMLAPVLEQLEEENDKLEVVKVNVDENSELARNYRIMSIPTMILFKGGEPVKTIVGVKPKRQLEEELKDFI